jgi:hypothetical protein
MNLPTRPHGKRSWPRVAGAMGLQFAAWWYVFYVIMILLAVAEEVRLRRQGLRYLPPWAFDHVKVNEFQVTADGRGGVAVMGFRVSRAEARIVPDVVWFDLERRTASRLGLSRLAPRCVALAPHGDSIAIASDRSVFVASGIGMGAPGDESMEWDVRVLHRTQDEDIGHLVFSPDGRLLAAVGVRYTYLVSLREGGPVYQLAQQDRLARAIFSEDSQHLILFGFNQPLSRYDARSGRPIASRPLPEYEVVSTLLSAGGTLAAQLAADGDLSLWDLQAGAQRWRRHVAVAPQDAHTGLALSPDGRLLAVACAAGESFQVHFHDTNTGVLLGRSPVYDAAFKGLILGGDQIAYCWDMEGVLRAWDVTRECESWRFAWPQAATATHWPLEAPTGSCRVNSPAARWFRLHLLMLSR